MTCRVTFPAVKLICRSRRCTGTSSGRFILPIAIKLQLLSHRRAIFAQSDNCAVEEIL